MFDRLKNLWKSRTIWFNTLLGVFVANFDAIRDSLPQIQPYLSQHTFGGLMVAAFMINILLRIHTTTDLANK